MKRLSREIELRDIWIWLPVLVAAVFAVAVLANLGSIVHSIYLVPDVAAGPVIGQLIGQAPHNATVVLGNIGWYSEVWFEELTRGLPLHRQLWELTPWVLNLIGIGAVGWATARVASRWAGTMVVVALSCAGASLMLDQFGWSVHALAYFTICLYAVATVWIALIAQRDERVGPLQIAGLAVLTIVVGIQLACDVLVLIGGLIPCAAAGAVLIYTLSETARRRALVLFGSLLIGSVIVAALTDSIAHSDHLFHYQFPIALAPFNLLLTQLGDLVGSLVVLAGGNANGGNVSFTSIVELLAAAAAIAGIWAVLRIIAGSCRQAIDAVTPVSDDQPPRPAEPVDPVLAARRAFLGFWLIGGPLVGVVFWVSTLPVGLRTDRYVVPSFYAVVVIVAIWTGVAPRWWSRLLLTAGVGVVAFTGTLSVLQQNLPNDYGLGPSTTVAAQLTAFAKAHGLTYGYAGYQTTYPLTWETKTAVQIYPVSPCSDPGGLCVWPYHRISSWYTPRPHTPTFLLIDPTIPYEALPNGLTSAPTGLGKPTIVKQIGPLTVYVYPYDIASRIQYPTPATG